MICFGLIGFGYWGPNIARCLAADPDCRLTTICDVSASRRAAAAGAYPKVRLEEDWRRVVGDSRIDAIAIATPASSHFELAHSALDAGKHVLVEKPIALNAADVVRLIGAAERRRLVLMTDHTYVYSPAVQEIRTLLWGGALGRISRYDSVRTNAGGPRRDVDVLWDLAAHDFAILDFLFRLPPLAIRAGESPRFSGGLRSRASLCVYFPDSLAARIRVDWAAPAKLRRIEITGAGESLVFDDLLPSAKLRRVRQVANDSSPDPAAVAIDDVEPLAAAVAHFASCVRRQATPLTDGESALRVVRLLEAASRALAAAGSTIALGPMDRPIAVASP